MLVVDASAIVDLCLRSRRGDGVGEILLDDPDLSHAPDPLDAEVLHALRRYERKGELTAARAAESLDLLHDLPIVRHPSLSLLPRAWQLRRNITVYDALYVTLAEALEARLVTCDARLARAAARHARIAVTAVD